MTDEATTPIVYIDANPFIYFIDGEENVANQVRPFFKLFAERPGIAMTSELTLAEVLAKARPEARRSYFNLILWSKAFRLQPVTRDILIDTADYRQLSRRTNPDGTRITREASRRHSYCDGGPIQVPDVPIRRRRPDSSHGNGDLKAERSRIYEFEPGTHMTEPLLTVRDLSVAFRSGGREMLAVDRISFDIAKGETLALVGEFGLRQIGHRAVDFEAAALPVGAPSIGHRSLSRARICCGSASARSGRCAATTSPSCSRSR